MNVVETAIPGVLIIEPDIFDDARGFLTELYRADRYRASGISDTFVQDNLSRSEKTTLRGLHFQVRKPQGKLVTVLSGSVLGARLLITAKTAVLRLVFSVVLLLLALQMVAKGFGGGLF